MIQYNFGIEKYVSFFPFNTRKNIQGDFIIQLKI